MSLYASYLKERTNDSVIESDTGFITYRYLNEKQCYIIDIYVCPDFRQSGAATELANQVAKEAKQTGRTQLIGTVVPSTKGSNSSLRVLWGYGMTLDSASNDLIIMKKDI